MNPVQANTLLAFARELQRAVKAMRAAQPAARIVLSSGYTADIDIGDLLQSGGVFLPKPYDPDELLRLVRRVLDGG